MEKEVWVGLREYLVDEKNAEQFEKEIKKEFDLIEDLYMKTPDLPGWQSSFNDAKRESEKKICAKFGASRSI